MPIIIMELELMASHLAELKRRKRKGLVPALPNKYVKATHAKSRLDHSSYSHSYSAFFFFFSSFEKRRLIPIPRLRPRKMQKRKPKRPLRLPTRQETRELQQGSEQVPGRQFHLLLLLLLLLRARIRQLLEQVTRHCHRCMLHPRTL